MTHLEEIAPREDKGLLIRREQRQAIGHATHASAKDREMNSDGYEVSEKVLFGGDDADDYHR
jgi:hypothetical protein